MNSDFEKEYEKLNIDQKKAVDTLEGPVLVIAGPGTGKTQVLSLRIANILKNTDTDPKSILCLTFQDASVLAMKNRLQKFIGAAAYKVQVHTFHSFCSEIIRTFPYLFDFSEKVEAIKDIDKLNIFKEILENKKLTNLMQRTDVLANFKGIESAISNLKKEFITPQKLEQLIISFESGLTERDKKLEARRISKLKELNTFYKRYLDLMKDRNLIDFDDMIYYVTEAFSKNDDLVKYYQEQFLYTLVDEFQDTNNAQLEVIKAVSAFEGLDSNIFAVGDDDQAIFRFQGASSKNFEKFIEIFPKSEIIVLHTNYRSNQKVIDAAKSLITNNPEQILSNGIFKEKNLDKNFLSGISSKLDESEVQIHQFEHSFHEDFWIGGKINSLAEQGVPLNEIAIISRTNRQITNITKFLDRFGIPYQIKRSESLLEDKYIKDLKLIIEIISSPEFLKDDKKIWKLLTLEFFEFDNFEVFNIFHSAKKSGLCIYDFVIGSANISSSDIVKSGIFAGEEKQSFQNIRELFNKILALQYFAENNSFLITYTKIIHSFDLIKFFEKQSDTYSILNKISSLYQFIQSRTTFLKTYSIHDFLSETKLMEERNITLPIDPIDPESEDKINILTAHSAKGLEFKKVFIYQTIENKWEKMRGPSDGLKLPPLDIESVDNELEKIADEIDERRLFYVAVTRAKENLYLTYSKKYYDSDSGEVDLNEKIISKFVTELEVNNIQEHKDLVKKHQQIAKMILSEEKKVEVPDRNKDILTKLINEHLSLSATGINKYKSCHYKFLLEDLYKVPLAQSPNALLGSLVHEGIEKIHGKLMVDNEVMIEKIIESQTEKLTKNLAFEDIEKENISIDVLKNDLDKSLRIYYEHCKKNPVKKVRSEFYTKGILEGIPIRGRIDMVSEEEFGYVITDFKTAQNIPSITEFLGLTKNADKNHLRQLLFYKILLENSENSRSRIYSKNARFLRIEYIDLKESNVKIIELPVSGLFEFKMRSNAKKTSTFDIDSEIDNLKSELKETYSSIKNLEFSRTENRKTCQSCPLKEHCGR